MKKNLLNLATVAACVVLLIPVAMMFATDSLFICAVCAVYACGLYMASRGVLRPLWGRFGAIFGRWFADA